MNESLDKLRDVVLFVAGLLAIGSLILAAFEGLGQRIASASVLGAIGVVCTLIVFIPQLEVLKAFGVEAKLRERLNEADVILAKLNRLSALNAKVGYTMMAWSNRFDGPSAKDRQAIIDEIDKQIADLNLTPEQRREITGQYVSFIGFDLLMNVNAVYERYSQYKSQKLREIHDRQHTDANAAAVINFSNAVNRWSEEKRPALYLLKNWSNASLTQRLDQILPVQWMDNKELLAAKQFHAQMIAMYEACQRKGGYTSEAAEYYDTYRDLGGTDTKMKELFGVSLNDL